MVHKLKQEDQIGYKEKPENSQAMEQVARGRRLPREPVQPPFLEALSTTMDKTETKVV